MFESHQLVLQMLILVACGYGGGGVKDGIIWSKQMEGNKSTREHRSSPMTGPPPGSDDAVQAVEGAGVGLGWEARPNGGCWWWWG